MSTFAPSFFETAAAPAASVDLSWIPISGWVFADVVNPAFVTSGFAEEGSTGIYGIPTSYAAAHQLSLSGADVLSVLASDVDPFTDWAGKTTPADWVIQIRVQTLTPYDVTTWDPYVAPYLHNPGAAAANQMVGAVVFGDGANWDPNLATATTSNTPVPATGETIDEFVLTVYPSLGSLESPGGVLEWSLSGTLGGRSAVAGSTSNSAEITTADVADLDIKIAFGMRITGGSGASSTDARLGFSYRLVPAPGVAP